MRMMAAGLALLLAAASPAASVDDLGWLAGDWASEADGRWTEESWRAPRGGMMIGHSRSGRGEVLREYEFIRIARGDDGAISYIAMPQGRAPVVFGLVRHDRASATFENAAHDYPQRIAYVRDGDTLTATISAIDGSKARSWTYRRRRAERTTAKWRTRRGAFSRSSTACAVARGRCPPAAWPNSRRGPYAPHPAPSRTRVPRNPAGRGRTDKI